MKNILAKIPVFLAELKRRKVYTVTVAYSVSAWLLVEIASVVFPTFGAPRWAMQAFIIAMVAGLPIAVLLSWVFDFTGAGLVRTDAIGAGATAPDAADEHDADHQSADQLTLEGERRLISVLCCSLRLPAGEHDPELLLDVIKEFVGQCEKVIALYDGHLVRTIDDELVAYFGYPQAGENDAQNAVRSGLGIIGAVDQVSASRSLDIDLSASVGVHSGLVVVQESAFTQAGQELAIVGETPRIARWLKDQAESDTLLTSHATNDLTQGYFLSEELPETLPSPTGSAMKVFRVRQESGARTRLEAQGISELSPMIDRTHEMNLLWDRWEQACDRHGQIVLISGEAGIGKSRLIHSLSERVAAEPGTWLTPVSCSLRQQSTPLYPIVQFLETTVLGFKPEHSTDDRVTKLVGFLLQTSQPLTEVVPLFAALLSLPSEEYPLPEMTPKLQKQRTLDAIMSLLLERAKTQPLLLVMEDIHWADPTTLQFIGMIAEYGPLPRILALLTCRPPFEARWTRRANVTHLNVTRLPPGDTNSLVRSVARSDSLTNDICEHIARKSDGVPLFAEELTKAVLEIHGNEESSVVESEDHDSLIPATLQESLLARLDNLEDAKPVTQLCAAIGKNFTYELLSEVSRKEDKDIQMALTKLVEAEFLYQRGSPPRSSYAFRHALIQEIAYQSILKSKRREFHSRIVEAIQASFPQIVETQPELVAWHCTRANLPEQAFLYWRKAGQRALLRYANQEAISQLERALELLMSLPASRERDENELSVLADLGAAHLANSGYAAPGAGRSYERALELSERIGDVPNTIRFMIGLWQFHVMTAQYATAQALTDRMLETARTHEDTSLRVHAHYAVSFTSFCQGDFLKAGNHGADAIDSFKHDADFSSVSPLGTDSRVHALCWTAPSLWHAGLFRQARQRSLEAIDLARKLRNPYTLAMALVASNWSQQGKLETEGMAERACECLEIARDKGLHFWEYTSAFILGWLEVLGERPIPHDDSVTADHGIALMRSSLDAYRNIGALSGQVYMWSRLGQAYILTEEFEKAEETIAEGLTIAESTGERNFEAELYRLQGELHLLQNDKNPLSVRQSMAQERFEKAIEVAHIQNGKALELRATTSLARLHLSLGDKLRARESLMPLLAQLPEDEEAPDLVEARQVLNECDRE